MVLSDVAEDVEFSFVVSSVFLVGSVVCVISEFVRYLSYVYICSAKNIHSTFSSGVVRSSKRKLWGVMGQ